MQEDGVDYGLIQDAVLAVSDGKIAYVGPQSGLPSAYRKAEFVSLEGRLVTPALVDCHTHLVFGGNRAREFEMRLNGATYEEVARTGGGILSTVQATRAASEEELLADALPRVDAMMAEGVATIEIKSGYGLNEEVELRMLRVARRIAEVRPIAVSTSFLGAHALPAEFADQPDAYIDDICIPALRRAHEAGLVDAVDAFCEGIAFSPDQVARVFAAGHELGLPLRIHSEQLSNLGGTAMAASLGARSADHIEYLDEAGVKAMATKEMTAVILPGAFYTLRETQVPPVEYLRQYGVPMAVSTDANPGSSPMTSILLAMNMACTLFRMTPQEAMAGVTRIAARALGYSDRGILASGMRADLAIWDIEHPSELSYRIGFNPLHQLNVGGE